MSDPIYIVDDDADFLELLARSIHKRDPDIEVVSFNRPAAAIVALIRRRPALIITDLIFPGGTSGMDVVASAKSRGIPCMLCSEIEDQIGAVVVGSKTSTLRDAPARAASVTGSMPVFQAARKA